MPVCKSDVYQGFSFLRNCIYIYIYVPLCVGGSKGKAGIHLKYYPESRDTFEMYPGKVMHMIGG